MYRMQRIEGTAEHITKALTEWGLVPDPAFTPEELDQAKSVEVWGTTAVDPGADRVEVRLLGEAPLIAHRTVEGY